MPVIRNIAQGGALPAPLISFQNGVDKSGPVTP
jgi:hypothetical protein